MSKIDYTDISAEESNFGAVFLAELGFSNRLISDLTGLSPSAISYRTRMASVYRRDYRDGKSDVARKMIRAKFDIVDAEERRQLAKSYDTSHAEKLAVAKAERARLKRAKARRSAGRPVQKAACRKKKKTG
jgi:hypothetical protein